MVACIIASALPVYGAMAAEINPVTNLSQRAAIEEITGIKYAEPNPEVSIRWMRETSGNVGVISGPDREIFIVTIKYKSGNFSGYAFSILKEDFLRAGLTPNEFIDDRLHGDGGAVNNAVSRKAITASEVKLVAVRADVGQELKVEHE